MTRGSSILARVAKARAASTQRAAEAAPTASTSAVFASLIAAERAAAEIDGQDISRHGRAMERMEEVGRLSRAGLPVKQIAAQVGLSCNHVVALRAKLGVGRRR